MTRYFTLGAVAMCLFAFSSVLAQPTMTLADTPQDGDHYTFLSAEYREITASGPDATWDLSDIQDIGENQQVSFHDIDVVGYAVQFPTAQIAMETTPNSYIFQRADGTGSYTVGQHQVVSGLQFDVEFSDEQLNMPYPLTYGDSFDDDFAYTYTVQNMNVTGSGSVQFTAEGFGTLKLPYADVENVLMLRGFTTVTETAPTITITQENNTVMFLKPGLSFMVAQVNDIQQYQNGEEAGQGQGVGYTSEETFSAVGDVAAQQVGVDAWPVPARDALQIAYGLGGQKTVEITLHDATGKLVRHQEQRTRAAGIQSATMDVRDLPAGVYLLTVLDHTGQRGSRMVVVE